MYHPTRPRFRLYHPLLLAALIATLNPAQAQERPQNPAGGLRILTSNAQAGDHCPLESTRVTGDIRGHIARITVEQVFHNTTDQKIEALYTFPLPQNAAVNDMTMTVADRRIIGQIKPRDQAREIYEAAKAAGHIASLLDQERPNIFSQAIANIEPNATITIEISFNEVLKFDAGTFQWSFPTVVGPRYIPGGGSAPDRMTSGTPTNQVPDADRITPPVTPENLPAGHDVNINLTIDGGTLPVQNIQCPLHQINATPLYDNLDTVWQVSLAQEHDIPNRDFILQYTLGDPANLADTILSESTNHETFLTLLLQPPIRPQPDHIVPRELIFVLDTSGSMSGFPIEHAKALMRRAIDAMNPQDTFNLITFAGDTRILWPRPRPASTENINAAQQFLASRSGGGGTEMMKAINAALNPENHQPPTDNIAKPIRIVCFMTDGYVGNDFAIIDAVKNNAGTTRVFSFGIGNSVNRFLLQQMAHAGRGEVEFVTLADDAQQAVTRFNQRIAAPVLTDIQIDFGDLPIIEAYPQSIPDLFTAKPIMIHAKLEHPADGTITLQGHTTQGPYTRDINITQNTKNLTHKLEPTLAPLWARAKVDHLMSQDYNALQNNNFPENLKKQITHLGVKYRLLTQFTSFVAVEELTVTAGGKPRTVRVPVEMPDGVSYEGVFGQRQPMRGISLGLPTRGAKAAPASPGTRRAQAGRSAGDNATAVADSDDVRESQPNTPDPSRKIAPQLRHAAQQLDRADSHGNLTLENIVVSAYRVDVMIFFTTLNNEVRNQLTNLGFQQTGESKSVKLLTGTIDIRKLEKLAEFEDVLRIEPLPN